MSTALHGQLSFGYDLGSRNLGFLSRENSPAWTQGQDYIAAANRLLLASVGFTEEPAEDRSADYYQRRRTAEGRLGVTINMYGSDKYSAWMLTGLHVQSVGVGPTVIIEADLALPDGLLDKMHHAAAVLGIPGRPRWMLTGYYF